MTHRNLTDSEIQILKDQYCTCSDWSRIKVTEGFNPKYVKHVHFSGDITIGKFETVFELEGGLKQHSGIFHATLHNCQIGDNVFIANIHRYIANYIISDNCYIENTQLIVTEQNSTFGNGIDIAVLNEGGGREIRITDNLSSHLAYIQTLYRHRQSTIDNIKAIIDKYTDSIRSDMGYIAPNVKITACRNIKNVKIGEYAVIDSASELTNGSLNSNASDPIYIGNGVIAKNFIISSGVHATDDTLIENCFIGQGTLLGKHFSIYDSVYFCNCQGFHGEVCAVFGGPFTVTHHKSSLLIAGLFSFLNAGSGSNQSNHMYKLGPIHQGVVERGSKTTSDSYILWPAKIGAFSLVMGRHTHHSDTSNLPFSYLIENDDESYIVPGINIKSVGTIRDAQKWPKRDRRKDPNKLDQINFNLLSPYTIQKMYAGIDILNTLKSLSGETSHTYSYQSTVITQSSLKKGIGYYNMAINKFLGNSIIKRLEETKFKSIEEIRERLKPDTEIGLGTWYDLSGLIAPASEIDKLLNDIDNKTITTIEEINKRFQEMHKNYYEYEWIWALNKIEEKLGKKYTEFTVKDIIDIVHVWTKSVVNLDKLLYEDAKKEFDLISRTGFGVDGGEKTKTLDFNNVRGIFEENPFVKEVLRHIEVKTALGQELINRIEHLA
jgi:NDP-sugar pyrophosphorylase family protein